VKVLTKEILVKVIDNLNKKKQKITYDNISEELDMTRSVVIEQCKEFSDFIKEEKDKQLIQFAKDIAKEHNGEFVKLDDTHNRLYTFKCSDPSHKEFTTRLAIAEKEWCKYCSSDISKFIKNLKKKDLSEITANQIFNDMNGNKYFKNVMALSFALRSMNIKIKDTSTRAQREPNFESAQPKSTLKELVEDFKSKNVSNMTINEIFNSLNEPQKNFILNENGLKAFLKVQKITTKESQ
jgi:hypothetical protein